MFVFRNGVVVVVLFENRYFLLCWILRCDKILFRVLCVFVVIVFWCCVFLMLIVVCIFRDSFFVRFWMEFMVFLDRDRWICCNLMWVWLFVFFFSVLLLSRVWLICLFKWLIRFVCFFVVVFCVWLVIWVLSLLIEFESVVLSRLLRENEFIGLDLY